MLASFALHVLGDDPGTTSIDENEYYNQLQELEVEKQNEALTLAETFVDVCSFTPQTEVTTAEGVWNSQAAGQTYVNDVIARTPDSAWKKQSDGSYRIDVKDANVPGYIVSSTGYKSSAGGVRIVVVDLGTANQRLVSTFPQYSGFFPSSG